jgi:hypothetical protein
MVLRRMLDLEWGLSGSFNGPLAQYASPCYEPSLSRLFTPLSSIIFATWFRFPDTKASFCTEANKTRNELMWHRQDRADGARELSESV